MPTDRLNTEWMFDFVSAAQVWVCRSESCDLADAPALARQFVGGLPVAIAESPVVRAALLGLAARWGYTRHAECGHGCPAPGCQPEALGRMTTVWGEDHRPATEVFCAWVTLFASELLATHHDVDRASSLRRAALSAV